MTRTTRRRTTTTERRGSAGPPVAVVAGALVGAAGAYALSRVGWSWALAWVASFSVVTLAVFGLDKLQARRGKWRVSEASLLLLSLLGGTPGALMAMSWFRHKTVKRSFRVAFWFVALAQIGALALLWWANDGELKLD